MSEPYALQIAVEQGFDGQTPMKVSIGDFERGAGRHSMIRIPGPAGIIAGDFFGLFSSATPKIVGLATRSLSHKSKAWVVGQGTKRTLYREQIDLEPRFQHVVLFPGDRLEIVSGGEGLAILDVLVNDLSEAEHVEYALRQERSARPRRLRLIRTDGSGFVPLFDAEPWSPAFAWDELSETLTATENTHGPIPLRAFGLGPRSAECFVSVRYLNTVGPGKLHLLEPTLKSHVELDAVVNPFTWSKVQFLSHLDHLVLESPGPAQGVSVIAEIEIVEVRPIERMQGRYDRGL